MAKYLPIEMFSLIAVETVAFWWRLTPAIVRDTIEDGISAADIV